MTTIKQKIHFKVAKNGDTTLVDVVGAGTNCQALTGGIEAALGVADENTREATASLYEPVDHQRLNVESNCYES